MKGTVNSNGYLVVNRKGIVLYVHRLVAAEMLGRELLPGEQVHHRNGNRADNRPANLEILTAYEHAQRHRQTRCKNGHDLTDEANLYRRPDTNVPICRPCARERDRRRHERERANQAA